MKLKPLFVLAMASLLFARIADAHCPLCTIGAGALAGSAAWLGVSKSVIGVFIGAFAVSTGWWMARLIKKKVIPYQMPAIILASYLLTVLPLIPLLKDYHPLYLSWLGTYGTTYAIDVFLLGSIVGGIIVCITPWLSAKLTALRKGNLIPYQGISLTFGLLFIAGIIMQVVA
ncbi:TPA: hypothetical protein HA361_01485 [Candidatus Woesearchaeota archaeon]|nr:hypothetical protein [Candidatus Woesearchaeota archaeon]HII68973.1 hypothetical protein [Candidatus Woesearchaeota archaeon]